jgi:hypothetical protein
MHRRCLKRQRKTHLGGEGMRQATVRGLSLTLLATYPSCRTTFPRISNHNSEFWCSRNPNKTQIIPISNRNNNYDVALNSRLQMRNTCAPRARSPFLIVEIAIRKHANPHKQRLIVNSNRHFSWWACDAILRNFSYFSARQIPNRQNFARLETVSNFLKTKARHDF